MEWLGPVLVIVFLVLVGPVSLLFGGAVWSAVLGFFASEDADDRYADSEYVKHRLW